MWRLSARRLLTLRRRLLLVVSNSLNTLLLPFANVLISLWVVRLASVELWGAFVELLILVQLGAFILAWGNKEYLLRAFSLTPASVAGSWQSNLVTRLALLPLLALVMVLPAATPARWLLLTVWTLGLVICQSFEVLITYRRAFLLSIAVELGGTGALLLGITLAGDRLTLDTLLLIFTAVSFGKAASLAFALWSDSVGSAAKEGQKWINLIYFGAALPFFLLGFSGMLQSRIDLYSVSIFLPPETVGQYQVFINLMLYLQAIANFMLTPFVKALYRLDQDAIRRVSFRLLGVGIVVIPPALFAIQWVLSAVYAIELPPLYFVLGGLCTLPVYFYLPTIYSLYKADRQKSVLWINLGGTALNLLLNVIFVPRFGAVGALLATTVVQWFMLALYLYLQANHGSDVAVVAPPEGKPNPAINNAP